MKIEIKSRYDDTILLCGEYESIKDCLEKNRGANLGGAYLEGAYLEGANLEGAYLGGANLGGANLGGAKGITLPIITIAGSKHGLYYHNGKITIGCNILTVDEWLDNAESMGKAANYTDKEIAEYQQYIKLVDALVKANR